MTPAERPILMSGDMVRAIIDGRKTQTRRVVKPQPGSSASLFQWEGGDTWKASGLIADCAMGPWTCSYGQPGDRLWVRETWCPQIGAFGNETQRAPFYREGHPDLPTGHKWKPSIFMPRWASRITLEIVSVRVERLQDITKDDAIAEGIEHVFGFQTAHPRKGITVTDREHRITAYESPCASYKSLWDSINAKKHPWSSNPWVWRIEFLKLPKLITPNQKPMAKKPTNKKSNPDLPAMKGPGVEEPEIPEIEEAAEKYVDIRDKRMKLTETECTVRAVLSEVMHAHRGDLPKDEDGNSFYPFDGRRMILLMGKERIKVKSMDDPDDEEVE